MRTKNTMEANLIYLSYLPYFGLVKNKNADEIYVKFYNLDPIERLADIKAYQRLVSMLKQIKKYVPNTIEMEKLNIFESMIRGYKMIEGFVIPPTLNYFNQQNVLYYLKQFSWYSKDYFECLELTKKEYDLSTRLKYGLMIDDDEFKEKRIEYKHKEKELLNVNRQTLHKITDNENLL